MLQRYAEQTPEGEPPTLPDFVWTRLSALPALADFIGEGGASRTGLEGPLEAASETLRNEHARILRGVGRR